jgi:hypothetical protein
VDYRESDVYGKWNQRRSKIPDGIYVLRSFHVEKIEYKYRGLKKMVPTVVLFFDTVHDQKNQVIPYFLPVEDPDHIGKQSKYYRAWTLAAGHTPDRPRLKEMPLYMLTGKYFEGIVTSHRPLESEEVSRDLWLFDELSEPICLCGRKESSHGAGSECNKFVLKRMVMPEELWWSKVKILVRRLNIF